LRVAELARLYTDCKSSIVAELPPERWHLSLRVIAGASLDQIQEKRRDVRRGPYRRAHLTLNPVWQDDFMSARRGEKTLLVPLVVSTRLLGFWILNFPVDAHLEPQQVKLVSALARQVSLAVERRQALTTSDEPSLTERLLGDGRLGVELDAVGDDVKRLARDKRGLAGLVDTLPFGVLVATLWGEVRYVNAAMRRLAADEGVERLSTMSITEVIAALTPQSKDEIHDGLRRLVRELPELHLAGRPDPGGRRAKLQLVLSWLAREEQRADGEEAEQLLLLTAVPTRLASRAHARASDFQDEGTTQSRLLGQGLELDASDSTNPTGPSLLTTPVARASATVSGGDQLRRQRRHRAHAARRRGRHDHRRRGRRPAQARRHRGSRQAARRRRLVRRLMFDLFPPHGLDQTIHVAVLVGLYVLLFTTEVFGWVWSGLVVPGYLASVFLIQPAAGVTIVFESVLTFAIARLLSDGLGRAGVWSRFFGRERFLLIIVVSVLVRQSSQIWLLPAILGAIDARFGTSYRLEGSFSSIGLVLVPLTANMFWKLDVRRGLIQVGVPTLVTYLILRHVLIPFTNLSYSSLSLTYENVALDFLASPKAYIILLTGTYVAARYNLLYGWDFSGILIPALLALACFSPIRLVTTAAEACSSSASSASSCACPSCARSTSRGRARSRWSSPSASP
jgi:hypothetical protein